jgi:hypothetical protein
METKSSAFNINWHGFHVEVKLSRFLGIFRKNLQMSPKSSQIHIWVIWLRFLFDFSLDVQCYTSIRPLFDEGASYCQMETLRSKYNINWHGFHVEVKLSRFVGIFHKNMHMSPKSSQIHIRGIWLRFLFDFTLDVQCYTSIRPLFNERASYCQMET